MQAEMNAVHSLYQDQLRDMQDAHERYGAGPVETRLCNYVACQILAVQRVQRPGEHADAPFNPYGSGRERRA